MSKGDAYKLYILDDSVPIPQTMRRRANKQEQFLYRIFYLIDSNSD